MNRRKNENLFKLAFKGLIILFICCSILNNQTIFSYITGSLKSILYNWMVSDRHDITCVLVNPFFKPEEFTNDRCVSCESITKIPKLHDIAYEEIEINYIRRNSPVIITDAMDDWETIGVDVFNISETYMNQPWMVQYKPCYLLTNFDLPTNYIQDYFNIAFNFLANPWFIQWKNCDLRAVKVARNFYKQPYFMKYYIPAPKINWIILSHQYKTNKYYEINIAEQRLVQFMQLSGSFKVKLLPRQKCHRSCPSITDIINESEILVINSDLWSLQYKPLTNDVNVAIITESEM